jgi:hypothetical protein
LVWPRGADHLAQAKRSRGLVAAFFLILFPQLPISLLVSWSPGAGAAFFALIFFGLLFPDGRFAPHWTRWLAVFTAIVFAILLSPIGGSSSGLTIIPVLVLPATAAGAQIYRFRRISSWAERQETKWAFCGLVVGIASLLIFVLSGLFVNDARSGSIYVVFVTTGFAVAPSAIPITIAIAVLRSRLWDIDHVISRALAYTSLTVTLAAIYIGSVIGLQALLGSFVGNSSRPAIAISTLVVAALFGPLRRRIQAGIDRRFYRGKYDTARTLGAFGERLRDQVDLAKPSQELTSVVHDTLHPEHVSLWLREGGPKTPFDPGPTPSCTLLSHD